MADTLSNLIPTVFLRTGLPPRIAEAVAVEVTYGPPPEISTQGVVVYPVPELVTRIL